MFYLTRYYRWLQSRAAKENLYANTLFGLRTRN